MRSVAAHRPLRWLARWWLTVAAPVGVVAAPAVMGVPAHPVAVLVVAAFAAGSVEGFRWLRPRSGRVLAFLLVSAVWAAVAAVAVATSGTCPTSGASGVGCSSEQVADAASVGFLTPLLVWALLGPPVLAVRWVGRAVRRWRTRRR